VKGGGRIGATNHHRCSVGDRVRSPHRRRSTDNAPSRTSNRRSRRGRDRSKPHKSKNPLIPRSTSPGLQPTRLHFARLQAARLQGCKVARLQGCKVGGCRWGAADGGRREVAFAKHPHGIPSPSHGNKGKRWCAAGSRR
jgi:hypothetical protein